MTSLAPMLEQTPYQSYVYAYPPEVGMPFRRDRVQMAFAFGALASRCWRRSSRSNRVSSSSSCTPGPRNLAATQIWHQRALAQ